MPEIDQYLTDHEQPPRYRFIKAIPVILLVFTILAFRQEFIDVFKAGWGVAGMFLGFQAPEIPAGIGKSFQIILFNFVLLFGSAFVFWLFILSDRAIVPVRGLQDIYRVAWHLVLYILGGHGPSAFIKDGKLEDSQGKFRRFAPGIIVVDFNSAVVLEEMIPPPGLFTSLKGMLLDLLVPLKLADPQKTLRAEGAGIVFTRPWERIRGTVDLRRQVRIREYQSQGDGADLQVCGYTRDGIELSSNQWAIFTVGQPADVLEAAYVGSQRAERLRVVTLQESSNGRVRVSSIQDELDDDDRKEIHHFARYTLLENLARPYSRLPNPPQTPIFSEDRVFSAVFAQARTPDDQVIPWVDLPRRVAIDFFREELSKVNYEDLYSIGSNEPLPMLEFKRKIRNRVRNNGILSYRFVYLSSGENFQEKREYEPHEICVSEVRSLTGSKILRDRGIKVIASGFRDPVPVSETVYKLRLDKWRATWDRDTEIAHAGAELEAMRVRSRARVQTQQEMFYALTQIFQKNKHSDEVLAIRVLQSLENLAAEPSTQQLLPAETINLLRSVHDWLLPGDSILRREQQPPTTRKRL